MKRTRVLLEIRQMRFADLYEGWQIGRLSQQEAAEALGVSDRTFRRFSRRFEEDGANGLLDRRLGQVSARVAPVDEVMALTSLYRERYADWTVKHFFDFYQAEHRGARSYNLGQEEPASTGSRTAGEAARRAPAQTRATTTARNDAASGWLAPRMAGGQPMRSYGHHG
jgi:transposase